LQRVGLSREQVKRLLRTPKVVIVPVPKREQAAPESPNTRLVRGWLRNKPDEWRRAGDIAKDLELSPITVGATLQKLLPHEPRLQRREYRRKTWWMWKVTA
jgi:hypothetical protein